MRSIQFRFACSFLVIVCFQIVSTTSRVNGGLLITSFESELVSDFEHFRGEGLQAEPTEGQLDSDYWRITGLSDGSGVFGGSYNTGDWARGLALQPVVTGGIYGFSVGEVDWALGFQPTSGDMTPGTVTLHLKNGTPTIVNRVTIGFDLLFRNDASRSTRVSLSYGLDDHHYQSSKSGAWDSMGLSDTAFDWKRFQHTETLTHFELHPLDSFYFRWSLSDALGHGSRDEVALDNVKIQFERSSEVVPEAASLCWLATVLILFNARNWKRTAS